MITQKEYLQHQGMICPHCRNAIAANNERWIRLPVRGCCPYTGLSRAMYYQLIARGQIKSASLKQPGKLTGVRLVWLPSVLAFIERHVEPVARTRTVAASGRNTIS